MTIDEERKNLLRAEQSRAEQSRAEQSRAEQIDALKAVCAFLVVCIHAPFPGKIGEYFTSLTRVAVPIFFMITGFYYMNVVQRGKRLSQIKKVFWLAVKSNLVFLGWDFIYKIVKGKQELQIFFLDAFSLDSIARFFLYNDNKISSHLWYLSAVLYVLLIIWFIDRLELRKLLFCIVPFLLLGDLVLGKYSLLLFNREIPYYYIRNYLFVGVPYFCIGNLIYNFRTKIRLLKGKWLIYAMGLFSVTTLCERGILIYLGKNAVRDHYLSTTFLAISIFVYVLNKQYNETKPERVCGVLSRIGKEYSADIYILHPIFISILQVGAGILRLDTIYTLFAPILIYVSTIIFLVIVRKLKRRY